MCTSIQYIALELVPFKLRSHKCGTDSMIGTPMIIKLKFLFHTKFNSSTKNNFGIEFWLLSSMVSIKIIIIVIIIKNIII